MSIGKYPYFYDKTLYTVHGILEYIGLCIFFSIILVDIHGTELEFFCNFAMLSAKGFMAQMFPSINITCRPQDGSVGEG